MLNQKTGKVPPVMTPVRLVIVKISFRLGIKIDY